MLRWEWNNEIITLKSCVILIESYHIEHFAFNITNYTIILSNFYILLIIGKKLLKNFYYKNKEWSSIKSSITNCPNE